MTSLPDSPAITIRPVRADELDTYFALTLLVDLHFPADHFPALKDTIGQGRVTVTIASSPRPRG